MRDAEEPEIKRRTFSEEETQEIVAHFNLTNTSKTPCQSEIESFLGKSKFCIGRTERSIKNKIYYILNKLRATDSDDSDESD